MFKVVSSLVLALWLSFLLLSSSAVAEPDRVVENPVFDSTFTNIRLEGTHAQKQRFRQWLQKISLFPKGFEALDIIARSPHRLVIAHSYAARLSAGRTIAPMTSDLTNGVGASVKIIFDAEMPEEGTHRVFGRANQLIEFNAVQNLYHELAHAMHQMQGTWRYFASEKQAIEEENVFRSELARSRGEEPVLRFRSRGVLISNTGFSSVSGRASSGQASSQLSPSSAGVSKP